MGSTCPLSNPFGPWDNIFLLIDKTKVIEICHRNLTCIYVFSLLTNKIFQNQNQNQNQASYHHHQRQCLHKHCQNNFVLQRFERYPLDEHICKFRVGSTNMDINFMRLLSNFSLWYKVYIHTIDFIVSHVWEKRSHQSNLNTNWFVCQ